LGAEHGQVLLGLTRTLTAKNTFFLDMSNPQALSAEAGSWSSPPNLHHKNSFGDHFRDEHPPAFSQPHYAHEGNTIRYSSTGNISSVPYSSGLTPMALIPVALIPVVLTPVALIPYSSGTGDFVGDDESERWSKEHWHAHQESRAAFDKLFNNHIHSAAAQEHEVGARPSRSPMLEHDSSQTATEPTKWTSVWEKPQKTSSRASNASTKNSLGGSTTRRKRSIESSCRYPHDHEVASSLGTSCEESTPTEFPASESEARSESKAHGSDTNYRSSTSRQMGTITRVKNSRKTCLVWEVVPDHHCSSDTATTGGNTSQIPLVFRLSELIFEKDSELLEALFDTKNRCKEPHRLVGEGQVRCSFLQKSTSLANQVRLLHVQDAEGQIRSLQL